MKIEDLGLSARAYNVLKRARVDTVDQLQQLSDDDLLCLRNMGTRTLNEIREKVEYVKTMTNADRIRAMSDDELAEFIILSPEMEFDVCRYCNFSNPTPTDDRGQCLLEFGCYAEARAKAFKKWLKQPAEEVHHG